MCNNIIVLIIFIVLKIVAIFLLPIIIIVKRKKKYINILIILDSLLLLFFITCNIFIVNKCVYNSNIDGIERTKNENMITLYNKMHPQKESNYTSEGINPDKNYKTLKNTTLYYFNQNKRYMNNAYYECNGNKIYIDSFGSSITSLSIAISTLYNKSLNPVEIFNYYKEDNKDLCNIEFDIQSIFDSVMKRYGGITLAQISSDEVYSSISNGGLVIAELSANENSRLTCDSNYIVIYNISLDGKYKIVIPNQINYDYVCSYSSPAYGNIISKDNMGNAWSIDELNKEAIRYYLVKKG